ncbi:hypothetical protein ABPG77_000890 [Micractinium sp. CCAP 211/92]
MGQSLNALSGRAAAAEASQPPPTPPGYAAAEARARELLAGPFSCYADEVKGTGAAMRQLFDAWDAAGPGAPPPAWDILRGRPGVRLKPISWRELTGIVADGSERALGALGRTPEQIKGYWDYRDRVILQENASVADYLLLKVFGFPYEVNQADGKVSAVVPPGFFRNDSGDGSSVHGAGGSGAGAGHGSGAACSSAADGAADGSFRLVTVWRENDFPYYLEPGITHMNLWANRPLAPAEVEAAVTERVPPASQHTWFVNTPTLQSVPAIWHAHVLWQQPTAADSSTALGANAAVDGI